MSDAVPLAEGIRFGVVAGALDGQQARRAIESIAGLGYDSVFTGDHISFTGPIIDPLTEIAFWAALRPN